MTRIDLRSRRLLGASVLLLLAGVVFVSTATRRPSFHLHTAPWHLWKAGRMADSEDQEACRLRVTPEAQTRQTAPEESPALTPSIYIPHAETILPSLPLVVQLRHFRSPPTLG